MLSDQEPSDAELLEFLLSCVRSQNIKMDGLSDWYFPSNLLFKHRCKTAREAVVAAYKRHQEQCHAQ